jgi:uncharacterized membrane protein
MAATRPDLRVGDAEREATATALREHYAQGRLSTDELNERLDAAFAATTHGQLETVTHDLPHIQPAPPAAAPPPAPARRGQVGHGVGRALAALVTLAAVVTVVSVALHGGNHVGPTIAALIIGMLIVRALIASIFGLRHHHHSHHHDHHHQNWDRQNWDRQHWDRQHWAAQQQWTQQQWDRRGGRFSHPEDGRDDDDRDEARDEGPFGRRPHGHHHEHHRRRNGHGYSYHYEYNYDYPGDSR